jgi:hypothetical protein
MSRLLSFVAATSVLLAGCAPVMKLTPREGSLILLPRDSTASITGHFQREERHEYSMLQGLRPEGFPSPMDVLARAAGDRPVRNATVQSSLDWPRFAAKLAAGIGSWVLLHHLSPHTQPYGPLAYVFVLFAVPDAQQYRVEGDFAEWPHNLTPVPLP